MEKIYGIRVIRSAQPKAPTRPVWSGFTKGSRKRHKEFVRSIHDPKYDGELSFMDVEDDVLIKKEGDYQLPDGRILHVDRVRDIHWHGRWKKFKSNGAYYYKGLLTGYVNGDCDQLGHNLFKEKSK